MNDIPKNTLRRRKHFYTSYIVGSLEDVISDIVGRLEDVISDIVGSLEDVISDILFHCCYF